MQGSTQWAIGSRFDRIFLLFSMLVPFAFYGLYLIFEKPMADHFPFQPEVVFFVLFTALFDAPHILQTFFRTHGHSEEYLRRPLFHNLSLFLLVGFVVLGYFLKLETWILDVIGLVGGWHIVRQNIGFIKVYQRKEPSSPFPLHRLEIRFVYFTWIYFLLHEANTRAEWFASSWLQSRLWQVLDAGLTLVWIVAFGYLLIQNFWRPHAWQFLPKMIFLFGQALSFFVFAQLKAPFLVIIAVTTIAHNVQYFGWMSHYYWQRTERWKLPILPFAATWLFGLLLALGFFSQIPTHWLGSGILSLAILYNGLVLWHYFIDGFIWRFKSQPELNKLVSS